MCDWSTHTRSGIYGELIINLNKLNQFHQRLLLNNTKDQIKHSASQPTHCTLVSDPTSLKLKGQFMAKNSLGVEIILICVLEKRREMKIVWAMENHCLNCCGEEKFSTKFRWECYGRKILKRNWVCWPWGKSNSYSLFITKI